MKNIIKKIKKKHVTKILAAFKLERDLLAKLRSFSVKKKVSQGAIVNELLREFLDSV